MRGSMGWTRGAALVGLGMVAGVWPLAAQSVSVTAGVSGSDLREYDSPVVVGASVTVPVVGLLGLRVDLRHHFDDQRWFRSTCSGLIPPTSDLCRDDLFGSSFSLTTAGVGPRIAVPLGSRWNMEGALLWTRAAFEGVWTGRETGARLGRAPAEAHWGLSVVAGASFAWSERWEVNMLVRRESPQVNTCVSDTYYPYCEGTDFHALELGVGLRW